ncbi:hypothetical protein M422DRAFT_267194 [Sphaerobolus stellatus SS14]|uniref:F-box domain-containing protein n=1 Tax=Sphaerobolus stellatus (strain SS14) TaxID=990650 RepID=A0A0C9TMD0_SPHS4|nr:hypothetical protein M422DRAFT_267194 [Sphaerobolus stellatus SS14]
MEWTARTAEMGAARDETWKEERKMESIAIKGRRGRQTERDTEPNQFVPVTRSCHAPNVTPIGGVRNSNHCPRKLPPSPSQVHLRCLGTGELGNLRSTHNEIASLYLKTLKIITPPGQLISFHLLPTELHLELFSHFPLKALIVSRAVCHQWRKLVPAANIPPACHLLL